MLILLLAGLRAWSARRQGALEAVSPELQQVQRALAGAAAIGQPTGTPPVWPVRGADGQILGLAAMTSPMADRVTGYAGPSNVLILFEASGEVTAAELLSSHDTIDHVARVRAADRFWQQFVGRSLGSATVPPVDGVSGATLTSLAIAEAINLRLSGKRQSLRFPEPPPIADVRALYPAAERIEADPERAGFMRVTDSRDATLGWLLRTGPLVDDVNGYQGPTELLMAIDSSDVVTKIRLGKSFDNDPYVRYTRTEASFWSKFVGRPLSSIAQMDLQEEGIEGVSGATMTSMAVAETIRRSARRHLEDLRRAEETGATATSVWSRWAGKRWNWSIGELATAGLALAVVPWSLSRLRGRRAWRRAWQLIVILIMVGLSGNLISMALLAGWIRAWPAVTLAPGLSILVMVALVMPAITGRNVYCDHVCPHGMAQQWVALGKRKSKSRYATGTAASGLQRHWSPGWKLMRRALRGSALLVIALSIGWIVWGWPSQLTLFEPFDVYAWRIGLSVSLAVWIVSLLVAYREPMGYCRLACPTGKLLDSVRRKRTGRHLRVSDMLLALSAAAVWCGLLLT